MLKAIDHLNIVVTNLERSERFYTELLDFRVTRRAHLQGEWIERIVGLPGVSADVVYIVAPGGEPRLELLCYKNPTGVTLAQNSLPNTVGLRHIAFQVDDIDGMAVRLRQAGIHLFGEPVTVPDTVVRHENGQKDLLYFTDPDGVILELAEYK